MRKLPQPIIQGVDTLKLCATSIRSIELKEKIKSIEKSVSNAEHEYRLRGALEELYLIDSHKNIQKCLTGKEMERIYNNTFVKSAQTRNIYDKIKKSCENDICPLCGQGTVNQLDHYLPISDFPIYGVSPINLVPACSDCNKNKLARWANTANEQTLHPYFDDIEQERWLYAEVIEMRPAAIRFYVKPPVQWGVTTHERIRTHFTTFGLASLYATHAAIEISNIRFSLQRLAQGIDYTQKISFHLKEKAESCMHARLNSWQSASYDAMANSDWFCSEGFML